MTGPRLIGFELIIGSSCVVEQIFVQTKHFLMHGWFRKTKYNKTGRK